MFKQSVIGRKVKTHGIAAINLAPIYDDNNVEVDGTAWGLLTELDNVETSIMGIAHFDTFKYDQFQYDPGSDTEGKYVTYLTVTNSDFYILRYSLSFDDAHTKVLGHNSTSGDKDCYVYIEPRAVDFI